MLHLYKKLHECRAIKLSLGSVSVCVCLSMKKRKVYTDCLSCHFVQILVNISFSRLIAALQDRIFVCIPM
jgi:hypothetical protein